MRKFKKDDNSLPFYIVKVGAVVLFLVGLAGGVAHSEDLNTIVTFTAAAEEELTADQLPEYTPEKSNSPFLSSKLNTSVDAKTPDNSDEPAVGGSTPEPSFATAQNSALIAANIPVMPDTPSKERSEVTKYTVKPNDTPAGIAEKFGLSLNTLLWANDLSSSSYIHPGDELFILPVDGVQYEVKEGDTVLAIANRYDSTVDDILKHNGIESAEHLVAGQRLIIPGGEKPTTSSSGSERRSAPQIQRYASTQRDVRGYFMRPAVGIVTQGLHGYNAVDIADSCWTPVRASASGRVQISVGNGYYNGGYGNYVKIVHPNNTRTLYAHMARVDVYSGQQVQQGQVIGRMGSTGLSTGCHVHMEVHGARNPFTY